MGLGLALALTLAACHKEEQAVVGVAKTAEKAEQKAQATASERDSELAQFALIPLPTKSMYVDVHEPSAWANPFLSVGTDMVTLRITLADANPSTVGEGTLLRPAAARRQELQLRARRPGKGRCRSAAIGVEVRARDRRCRIAL